MDSIVLATSLASVLVVGLALYAAYLFLQLRVQASRVSEAQAELNAELHGKNLEARQSIQIIARALLQKDLTDTEAAMRIAYLAQQVSATEDEAEQFTVFQQLAEATSHIPILEDWQMLEKSEKRRLNKERAAIELTYAEFIQAGAERLIKIKLN
jgi:DNA-directed RNA polymerase beta subunit